MRHVLEVSVRLEENGPSWEEINTQLYGHLDSNQAVGRYPNESGTGFGCRDVQWDFATRKEAEEAEIRIRKLNLPFEITNVYDDPETKEEAVALGWDAETIKDYFEEEGDK